MRTTTKVSMIHTWSNRDEPFAGVIREIGVQELFNRVVSITRCNNTDRSSGPELFARREFVLRARANRISTGRCFG